jgi:NADH-quinone oxidoreductase subunit M
VTIDYLSLLVFLPLIIAAIFPLLGEKGRTPHIVATIGSAVLFLISLVPWAFGFNAINASPAPFPWMPSLGISYAMGADGISMTLATLTCFLLLMAVVASYTNITKRLRLYYSLVFILATSILGVFLSRDAFQFFLFWELELIPMYLLIAIWGGPRRDYASIKFVLYTLFGSVFMVAALLGYYFLAQGVLPPELLSRLFLFDTIQQAVGTGNIALTAQVLMFLGFFIAFAVKLPVVPVHTWLPDAHVEAPTPISMLLAGILLKMGAYGMLRFGFDFFPQAAHVMAPYLGLLGFINIVYTAGVALVQKDLKKLIAYSSVSHMGFVLLGLAALNPIGLNGAMFVMVSHGLVSAALFMCVGTLYVRTHTRMIADYSGMAARVPIIFWFFLYMAMSSLGLPALISFAGETLVFYGAFLSDAFDRIVLGNTVLPWSIQTLTILSTLGVVLGAGYLLWMIKRVFGGPLSERWTKLPDATRSEIFVLGTLSVLVLAFGLYPKALTDRYDADVTAIANSLVQAAPQQKVSALRTPRLVRAEQAPVEAE